MSGVSFKVSADTAQADARLAEINKSINQIKVSANSLSSTLSSTFKNIAAAIGFTTIGMLLKEASDNAVLLENKMKSVADSAVDVAAAMKTVRDLAIETRSSVDSTSGLFQKYSKAAQQLGASTSETLKLTRLTAQAIQMSGSAAESANAAVIQLGQGLSSGVLRGEELNSVLEQAPRLAQALADGLGIATGELRKMGAAGKLTSEQVFSALLSQADRLNEEFSRTSATMASQVQNIKTSVGYFTSEVMKGLSSGGLGQLLKVFSDTVYESAETIQASVAHIASGVRISLSEIWQMFRAIGSVGRSIYASVSQALPYLASTRTMLGDILKITNAVTNVVGQAWTKVFTYVASKVRALQVQFITLFGALDFEVPKAMREMFAADSIVEFTTALKHLSAGIDGNTNFILNRLKAVPRQMQYFAEDLLGYFGLFDRPMFRLGYFEPLFDSLREVSAGIRDGVLWTSILSNNFGFLKNTVANLIGIFLNLKDVFLVVAKTAIAVGSAMVDAVAKIAEKLGEMSRNFLDSSTFEDIYESAKEHLDNALRVIVAFGRAVIKVFFDIYDAVIGHSWWTDTVETVVSTSNSLWDRVSGGLNTFASNVKSVFRSIYEDRSYVRAFNGAADKVSAGTKTLIVKIQKIDFQGVGEAIKEEVINIFNNIRDNYKSILETAGVAAMFLAFASLFPGAALAQIISGKMLLAIALAMLAVSDKITADITGRSPLGAIATTIGEVLGRQLFGFIQNIPTYLNAALSVMIGFIKGFVGELPVIGDILKGAISNIPMVGGAMGLVGSIFFGKGLLSFLNLIGMVKVTPVQITEKFLSMFALLNNTATRAGPMGLIGKAMFGPSETALIASFAMWGGAFDAILGDSIVAKIAAQGGLMWLFMFGMKPGNMGTALAATIDGIKAASTKLGAFMGTLSIPFATLMLKMPRSVQIAVELVKIAFAALLTWFKSTFTAMNTIGFFGSLYQSLTGVLSSLFAKLKSIFSLINLVGFFGGLYVRISSFANSTSNVLSKVWFATLGLFSKGVGSTWVASIVGALDIVWKAMVAFQVRSMAFATGPVGQMIFSKKGMIGAAAVGAALYTGASFAGTGENATEGKASPTDGLIDSFKQLISSAASYVYKTIKDNFITLAFLVTTFWTQVKWTMGILAIPFKALGSAISTLLSFKLPILTMLRVIVGTLASLGGALLFNPITLVIAGLVGASALLLNAFGEGDTFADKLRNAAIDIGRFVGLIKSPKELVSKEEMTKPFSKEAIDFAKKNGSFDPTAADYKGISLKQSDATLANYAKRAETYNQALERGAREAEENDGVMNNTTSKEIAKAAEKLQAQVEVMRKATSDKDPVEAVAAYFKALPYQDNSPGNVSARIGAQTRGSMVDASLAIERAKYGFSGSEAAKKQVEAIEKAERRATYAAEELANATTPRAKAFAMDSIREAVKGVYAAKYTPNGSGINKDDALKASEVLRALEDASKAAVRDAYEATTRIDAFARPDAGGNTGGAFDSEGIPIKDYGHFGAQISKAIGADATEPERQQISAAFQDLTEAAIALQKSRGFLGGKESESQNLRFNLESRQRQVSDMLKTIGDSIDERRAISKYKAGNKEYTDLAASGGFELDPNAMLVKSAYEKEVFKDALKELEKYGKALSNAKSDEEALLNLRIKSGIAAKLNFQQELDKIRVLKGEKGAAEEAAKKAGFSDKVDIIKARSGNATFAAPDVNGVSISDRLQAIANIKDSFDQTVAIATKNMGLAEEMAYRQNLLDSIASMEDELDEALVKLMTPRERVIEAAGKLGVVLPENIMKGLVSPKAIAAVEKKLMPAVNAKKNLGRLPMDTPADVRDKATTDLSNQVNALSKSFEKGKSFSDLFSGSLGITLDMMRVFTKTDFSIATKLAKGVELLDKKIAELSINAKYDAVVPLLKQRFDKIKEAGEVAAKYAFNSFEKIENAFSSLGFADTIATPQLESFVKLYTEYSEKFKLAAKDDTETSAKGYLAYSQKMKAMKRLLELAKDLTANSPGEKLDLLNSQLKTSFSDEVFANFDKTAKDKLSNFALFYKHSLMSIRNGELGEEASKGLLKSLEKGLRATQMFEIFSSFGKEIVESSKSSYNMQLKAIKAANSEIGIDDAVFKKIDRGTRESLTSEAMYIDFFKKISDNPAFNDNKELVDVITEGLNNAGDLKGVYDRALQIAETAVPEVAKQLREGSVFNPVVDGMEKLTAELAKLRGVFTGEAVNPAPAISNSTTDAINSATYSSVGNRDAFANAMENREKGLKNKTYAAAPDANRLALYLEEFGVEGSAFDINRMGSGRRGELVGKVNNLRSLGPKSLDNAAEYEAALADLKAFSTAFITNTDEMIRQAGDNLRATTQENFASMLKNSLSGQEGGLTLKGVIMSFAKNITDNFAESFTKDLMGEGTVLGKAMKEFGSYLAGGLSKLFSGGGSATGGIMNQAVGWIAGLFMADGGHVRGPGTGTSDSIPAMLSNGEFVVNAAATKEYGELLARINNGSIKKYASGGIVIGSSGLDRPRITSFGSLSKSTARQQSVFNINVTGDVSMQTRREIQQMIPQIANGVNMHNYEQGIRA